MSSLSFTRDDSSLQLPACSIIFVLHNAQYEVERRLSPFLSDQLNAELIIIDDASEDGTDNAVNSLLDHFEYEATVYLRNETRRGYGLCLNEALIHASAPILLIVDATVEIDIETMRRALALLGHSDAAFSTPSGTDFGSFENLRHHIYEQKVPASAAFLIHSERISPEQLFFNPFISEGHAADLRLRTAGSTHTLEVAPFITGLGGQTDLDLSTHLLMELSRQEASVMAFHAGNAAALQQEKALSPAEEDPALLYKRALSFKLDGRITDALHLCDDILYQYPGHDDAEELKIELLQRLKQFVEASELKHQRNMKRRGQPREEAGAAVAPPPEPLETQPAEEIPAVQESPAETPETPPEDDSRQEMPSPEPEIEAEEQPVQELSEAEQNPAGPEAPDTEEPEEEEMLIDPRFLPDTDFFDDEEEEEEDRDKNNTGQVGKPPAEVNPDTIEAPPASSEDDEEKAESRTAAPETPSDAEPAHTTAGESLSETPAEEPAEALPEAVAFDNTDTTSEPADAPAAEEQRAPQELPEEAAAAPPENRSEENTAPEPAEPPAAEDTSGGQQPPELEPESEPEPEPEPERNAILEAREEDARSPYKRPMNFYYTIIMPIAGMAQEMLENCLLSLEENCDPDKTELIIIDNACLDDTHEYLKQLSSHKFFHVHVITNRRNQGFGRSVNQGIKKALGEYICILHNDVALQSDLLFELSEILTRNPKVGLVGPKTDKSVNPEQVGEPVGNSLAMEEAMYLDSFCIMMRAEDNYRFSEDYAQAWFDDADLSFQVRQNGKRSVVATGVFLPHYSGGTTEQLGFGLDSELYQKNLAHFNKKWKIDPPMPEIEEAEHPLAEIYELGQLVNVYYPDEKHVARIDELFTPAMESELQRQKNLEDEALIYFIRAMMAIDNRPSLRMLEEQLQGKLDEVYVLELVRYYYQRHIYSRCKKHMSRVKGQPGLWFAMYELRIAYQDKELERVAELLSELMEAYPAHPEINKIAADMYQFLGDKAESEAFYSLVNQIDPFHYAWPEED